MIDTHCHLNYPKLENNLEEVLKRAENAGIKGIVCVGTALVNMKSNEKALRIANKYSTNKLWIKASVGVYPHEDTKFTKEELLEKLENLLKKYDDYKNYIVAIGECGLDLNATLDRADASSGMEIRQLEEQVALFQGQLLLAKKYNLPLIVHSRNSATETLKILKKHYAQNTSPKTPKAEKAGGIIHSFTYDYKTAQQFIDLGFLIGINGIVTFKNAAALQETVAKIPLEKIVLETDAPYLAPIPHRGETNEPSFVPFIAEKIAQIKNLPLEKVISVTTKSALEVLRLK